ncbi:MAG: serine hydrolase [Rhodovarius sp.]|nr:serine hydrolase [Rhodovarius sp.]
MTTLEDALDFIARHETPWPRDLRAHLESGAFEPPPDNAILGPIRPRGPVNAIITRNGEVLGRVGDTRQIDQTFSVAKSYLAIIAGLAVADGLIPDIDRPVGELVRDGGFDSPHNAQVTWRHLLTNTSEWEGELFGKHDRVDRGRVLSAEGRVAKNPNRPLQPPGSYWEYNDVRVNRLSLALMRLFAKPLPDIFAARIMIPIGASEDWRWEGYANSWVEVGGLPMQAVPGGTHWGGGVSIHAEDQVLVGQLMAQRGAWGGRQLLPAEWVAAMTSPCPLNPEYGFLTWLNPGRRKWPAASERAFCFVGAGGNVTWIEPEDGLVCVFRWLDPAHLNEAMGLIRAALA